MHSFDRMRVVDGICEFRPRGKSSLAEAVELISRAIAYCRREGIDKLIVNGTGLTDVSIPTLVDRFLMVEEWAQKAAGVVKVAMVVHAHYIHPTKFGVRVALDFGLITDVYTSEVDAMKWLSQVP